MFVGNVGNKFLNKNCFTYTCTAEQTDFTTLCVGADQVNDLDTGLEDLGGRLLFDESDESA